MRIAAQTELRWRTVLAFAEFPLRLCGRFDVAVAAGRTRMKISVCLQRIIIGTAPMLFWFVSTAHAEVASVYGGRDGYCGSRTANGERVNCSAMTAAHRRLPFGARVRVCHSGCVTVRINDRGPWVRGRDIDLTPAAARAIGLDGTGHVTVAQL
jgi:rare lipoprotein A